MPDSISTEVPVIHAAFNPETFPWLDCSEDSEFPGHRLCAKLELGPLSLHGYAYEVYFDEKDRMQKPRSDSDESDFDAIFQISSGDCPRQAFDLNGRQYVVVFVPRSW
jgi:hypothetical protein